MNARSTLSLDGGALRPSESEGQGLDWSKSLPRILRGLGAVGVIAALASFLLQQWGQGNDLHRYLMLFGTTLALASAGFLGGHYLREPKGARTFLTLGLVAVPVNFTILGALLYSQVNFDGGMAALPGLATWKVADLSLLLPLILVAAVSLTLVARLGFMVLARRSASSLTSLGLASYLLLLIPTRDPQIIGGLLLLLAGVLSWRMLMLSRSDPSLHTFEGLLARLVILIAPGIMLVRNLWLHAGDELLALGGAASVYLLLRAMANELESQSKLRGLLEAAGLLPALVIAAALAEALDAVDATLAALAFVGAFSALCWETSRRSLHAGGYRRLAALASSLGLMAILVDDGGMATASIALVVGGGMAIWGNVIRQRSLLFLGVATAVVALGFQAVSLIEMVQFGNWVALAIAGFSAIFAASLVERHGAALGARWRSWRNSMADWEG